MNYRKGLAALLGASTHRGNPAWTSPERALGVRLPDEHKEFVDGYGPVRVNSHPHFDHPTHPDRVDLSCADFASEDPRFGGPDQLIPLFGSDRGECFFFKPGNEPRMYVYVGADDDIYRYDARFGEWLYRYLQGQDMASPNSSAATRALSASTPCRT